MNITHDFATYLSTQGYGTLGTNLFIGAVPLSAPSSCYWILSSGGSNQSRNNTGERLKNYLFTIYYRSIDPEAVYNNLQALEVLINSSQCIVLANYDTIEAQATSYPTDQDIDSEERTVGMLQVNLTIYTN